MHLENLSDLVLHRFEVVAQVLLEHLQALWVVPSHLTLQVGDVLGRVAHGEAAALDLDQQNWRTDRARVVHLEEAPRP